MEAHPWPQIEANQELHDSLSQNNNRKQRVEEEEEEKTMPSQDSAARSSEQRMSHQLPSEINSTHTNSAH